ILQSPQQRYPPESYCPLSIPEHYPISLQTSRAFLNCTLSLPTGKFHPPRSQKRRM
ncbi:hypothetical protein AVEN_234290-2-1, partial [Araneus ventricosus]